MDMAMSFSPSEDQRGTSRELHLPADVHWDMLDKSRFFLLGAALFSGVSATLYPVTVLKTRQQVSSSPSSSSFKLCRRIFHREGITGLYRGFLTSLLGTIPARMLYMSTLEITKSMTGYAAMGLGFSSSAAATSANAVGGLAASVAAQLVWTPVDVISQRLMVQGSRSAVPTDRHPQAELNKMKASERHRARLTGYRGGLDAFKSIICVDGWRGLYQGFGMSILTYAPSNALWWASYCLAQRTVWGNIGYSYGSEEEEGDRHVPSSWLVIGVQGVSAACAGGITALLTTPLDTIKTRVQVMADGEGAGSKKLSARETVVSLFKEGGWRACYKGFGPRWATMAMSATTMITTYEFVKRSSMKKDIRDEEDSVG